MNDQKVIVKSSSSLLGLLFVILVILKGTGVITCSWWWIFAPIWIPFAAAIIITLLAVITILILDSF